MKVFLRNQAYKSLVITSVTKAGDVCSMMAEKLGLEKYAHEFDVVECVKGNEKRVDPGANIMRLKKEWPTILGSTGNETDKHCKLIVAPKRGSSSELQNHYRNAMYGKVCWIFSSFSINNDKKIRIFGLTLFIIVTQAHLVLTFVCAEEKKNLPNSFSEPRRVFLKGKMYKQKENYVKCFS